MSRSLLYRLFAFLSLAGALLSTPPCHATAAPGLLAEYFDFIDTPLTDFPDLSGLVPDAVLVEPRVWHPSTSGAWDGLEAARFTDRFAARYSGFLDVPADGTYTFALSSDDGSRLWIDGVLAVDHGGAHSFSRRAAQVWLAAGAHDILLLYFENGGAAGLELSWSGPGFGEEAVPASSLSHDPSGGPARPSAKMLMRTGAGFARAGLPSPLECAAWDGDAPAAAVSYLIDGAPLDA
ncbi:MAG: hypothetical protein IJR99_12110, partial [Kiritimatiellae bacterium]|nr:hypothetical protein [Kiritimatiellia bacterium]